MKLLYTFYLCDTFLESEKLTLLRTDEVTNTSMT